MADDPIALNRRPRTAKRKKKPQPLPPELRVRKLPRIKRTKRANKTYYYFDTTVGRGKRTYVALPDPTSPDFESAYSMIHAITMGEVIDPFEQPGKLIMPGTDRAYQCYLHHVGTLKARGFLSDWPPEARSAMRRKSAKAKTIYFAGGDDGPIKIGCSMNLRRRLKDLQKLCPIPIRILATTYPPRRSRGSDERGSANRS